MAITEKISKTTTPTFWEGEIPVNYIYTFGLAGEESDVDERGVILNYGYKGFASTPIELPSISARAWA